MVLMEIASNASQHTDFKPERNDLLFRRIQPPVLHTDLDLDLRLATSISGDTKLAVSIRRRLEARIPVLVPLDVGVPIGCTVWFFPLAFPQGVTRSRAVQSLD